MTLVRPVTVKTTLCGSGPPPRFARPSSVICRPAGIGRKRLLIAVGLESGTDLNVSAGGHDGVSAAVDAVLARLALTPPAPATMTARATALARWDRRRLSTPDRRAG